MKQITIRELIHCTWWQNFWNNDPEYYSELDQLLIALAKYNCRYVNTQQPYIEFDSYDDYIQFVLTWS